MNQTQRIFLRIFKIAAAASAGSFLAMILRLATPTSAGIIAILSLQNTRRETFSLVAKRILSFFPAMAVALTVFSLMGYRIFSIFIYLVLFAAICELFSLQNTLVSNTVLVLHLFTAQSAHPSLLLNELLLLLIGTACGILMNLYMPGNSARIRQAQARSEQIFRETFHRIAQDIVMDKQLACTFFDLSPLDLILEKLEKEAWENRGNTLLSDEQYFVKYVENAEASKSSSRKTLSEHPASSRCSLTGTYRFPFHPRYQCEISRIKQYERAHAAALMHTDFHAERTPSLHKGRV